MTAGTDDSRLDAFIQALPKCEVHLHLEGAVPLHLARAWSDESIPDTPEWWDSEHRYESFSEFIHVLNLTWRGHLNTLGRLEETASEIWSGLVEQNVRYVEMSFGVGAYTFPVVETVAALKSAVPDGLTVRIIAGLSRDRDTPNILKVGEEAIWADNVDGIDLHGNEREGDPRDFLGLYQEARSREMITKAHAGEFGGAASVVEMLDLLCVDRIQHGVGAAKDRALVQRFLDEGVTLDVCPWSNVKLGVTDKLAGHPLPALHRAGVRVTVSTDDPTLFGQTLSDEYRWLYSEMGMSFEEIGQIAANPFLNARMDQAERNACLTEIATVVESYEG